MKERPSKISRWSCGPLAMNLMPFVARYTRKILMSNLRGNLAEWRFSSSDLPHSWSYVLADRQKQWLLPWQLGRRTNYEIGEGLLELLVFMSRHFKTLCLTLWILFSTPGLSIDWLWLVTSIGMTCPSLALISLWKTLWLAPLERQLVWISLLSTVFFLIIIIRSVWRLAIRIITIFWQEATKTRVVKKHVLYDLRLSQIGLWIKFFSKDLPAFYYWWCRTKMWYVPNPHTSCVAWKPLPQPMSADL